eukprot:2704116-Rhodomonas_salina.1
MREQRNEGAREREGGRAREGARERSGGRERTSERDVRAAKHFHHRGWGAWFGRGLTPLQRQQPGATEHSFLQREPRNQATRMMMGSA